MKQPHLFVKIAVVISSVLLLAGCVAYRAGAFDWLTGSGPPRADSETKRTGDEKPPETTTPTATETPLTIMSSSKSIVLSGPTGPSTPATQPPTVAKEPAADAGKELIFAGSKSDIVFRPSREKSGPRAPSK
jgi:hypothetical protein